MKSLNKPESVFLILLSSIFLASGCLLARDIWFSGNARGGERVGTITYKNRKAEQKAAGSSLWSNLPQNGPVYNRDTIRTGTLSTAVISLNDDAEISLNEQSMVIIDVRKSGQTVKLASGSVTIQNSATSQPVLLDTGSGSFAVEEGTVQIRETAGKVTIQSRGGIARVAAPGTDQPLELGETAVYDASASRMVQAAAVLREPENGAAMLVAEPTAQVRFVWEADSPREFTVASDPDFRSVEYHASRASSGLFVRVAEGPHYWKVAGPAAKDAGATAETPVAAVGWFTVTRGKAPRQIAPLNDVFTCPGDSIPVTFSWNGTGDGYRLEVFRKEAGDSPVVSRILSQRNATVEFTEAGDYVWRITALAGPAKTAFPSGEARFTITKGSLQTPVIAGAPDNAPVRTSQIALRGGKPLAVWDPIPGAKSYTVSIAADSSGAPAIRTIETRTNSLALKEQLPAGTYYVSVKATAGSVKSPDSAPVRLDILPVIPLVAPTAAPAQSAAQNDQADTASFRQNSAATALPGQEISFKWTDPNAGSRYRLVASTSPEFTTPIIDLRTTRSDARAAIPESAEGILYWKTELLDDKGNAVAETPTARITVVKNMEPPVPTFPVRGEELDINSIDRVSLVWKERNEPLVYSVRLYRMTGGLRSLIGSFETTGHSIEITDLSAFALDSFAWELTAREPGDTGKEAVSAPVTSYFSIMQKNRLPVPKIRQMTSKGEY